MSPATVQTKHRVSANGISAPALPTQVSMVAPFTPSRSPITITRLPLRLMAKSYPTCHNGYGARRCCKEPSRTYRSLDITGDTAHRYRRVVTERFEWDGTKARVNARRHSVSFAEAATVFDDPLAAFVGDPDRSHDEERGVLIGYSTRQRLLVVTYTGRVGAREFPTAAAVNKALRALAKTKPVARRPKKHTA